MRHAREDYQRIQDSSGLIPEDEPVFLIRGKDAVGPAAVRDWALRAQLAGASPDIVLRARRWSEEMERYQGETGNAKVPDLPKEAP